MTLASVTSGEPTMRRRELQKEQTRLDLALAAFELAKVEGLSNVRVPQIADAVGVSPRTFNNYFSSKEAAIVFPTTLRGDQMANELAERPVDEPLADSLVAIVASPYGPEGQDGLPSGWLEEFRQLVAHEPALHGEYLKALSAGERSLATAIASRMGDADDDLEPYVLAAVVVAAERAAVLHWFRHASDRSPLAEIVATAVGMALLGILSTSS